MKRSHFTKNLKISLSTTRALYSSVLVALIFHMTDVTYYDGKISILIWVLLSSLKCIFGDTKLLKIEKL